jgi:hypothetical protein
VVERFLPEKEGDTYFVRYYSFVGSRFRSMRVGSTDAIVKGGSSSATQVGLPVPPELVAFRERHNLDFGNIDYAIHDGMPVIYDYARTPAQWRLRGDVCDRFAPGILPLLDRRGGTEDSLVHMDVDAAES